MKNYKVRKAFFYSTICLFLLIPSIARAQAEPTIVITPNPMDFGDVPVQVCATPQEFTVKNTSTWLPLAVFETKLSDSQNFSIVTDNCVGKVTDPGKSCTISASFCPAAAANVTASISLISFSLDVITSAIIEGRGVAPAALLQPATIAFGDHTVSQPSEQRIAVLANTGTSEMQITQITATDPFSVTSDCEAALPPSSSCNISVTFNPVSAGDFSGSVEVVDSAAGSPHTIALSGTGIPPGSADAGISKTSLDFGSVLVNSQSSAQQVVLSSTGTLPLQINSIVPSQNFAATNDCPASLPSGSTCNISVTFTPPSVGAFTGALTISDNATDSPQTVALSGSGFISPGEPEASLSTDALDFGDVQINTPAQPKNIVVTNNGGSPLSISEVMIAGDGESSYDATDDCQGATLAAGASCIIGIVFTPEDQGQLVASISITDNAADSPQVVAITGVGVQGGGGGGGCSLTDCASSEAPMGALLAALAGLVAVRVTRKAR